MRGKVVAKTLGYVEGRITPAYAGKSFKIAFVLFARSGSPPPMRGKAGAGSRPSKQSGITPAYAGKSEGNS